MSDFLNEIQWLDRQDDTNWYRKRDAERVVIGCRIDRSDTILVRSQSSEVYGRKIQACDPRTDQLEKLTAALQKLSLK